MTTTSAEAPRTDALIRCPRCSSAMRFAAVVPTEPARAQMLFDCTCGFEYRVFERGRAPETL